MCLLYSQRSRPAVARLILREMPAAAGQTFLTSFRPQKRVRRKRVAVVVVSKI
jgi:hypothetical protein